mmetsp:Transcript_22113/g.50962  ORF Transcript_22113/g.50962 Transcript_22113/m.50962 type:complete len:164 (-) Transcript_22113:45-536(-)
MIPPGCWYRWSQRTPLQVAPMWTTTIVAGREQNGSWKFLCGMQLWATLLDLFCSKPNIVVFGILKHGGLHVKENEKLLDCKSLPFCAIIYYYLFVSWGDENSYRRIVILAKEKLDSWSPRCIFLSWAGTASSTAAQRRRQNSSENHRVKSHTHTQTPMIVFAV